MIFDQSKYRKLCPKSSPRPDISFDQEASNSVTTRWEPPKFGSTNDDFPKPIKPSVAGEPGTSIIEDNANYHEKIGAAIRANYILQLPSVAMRLSVFYNQFGVVKRKFCSPLVLSSTSPIFLTEGMKYALPKQLDADAIIQTVVLNIYFIFEVKVVW